MATLEQGPCRILCVAHAVEHLTVHGPDVWSGREKHEADVLEDDHPDLLSRDFHNPAPSCRKICYVRMPPLDQAYAA